ncbi:hypothetical protein EO98_02950 [Methanosarcina sp. 2.H.T.1A.6]|nr:hypothetical protein EO94_03295 [Methanosarcina sp. 2.H.T.1A.3]KKG20421.1 hypothetical protein EO96_06450 [Methanosarcina sp. 2.H.T.1A.8]KKG21317.1 hypothetical protein EO97_13020 [Methanosarcina sp. 2.H.T.1A.15]KKG22506.1 hypothetical protein EO98_02950 [Methanosarcina sp. 2.H.T.1A.6]
MVIPYEKTSQYDKISRIDVNIEAFKKLPVIKKDYIERGDGNKLLQTFFDMHRRTDFPSCLL